MSIISFIKTDIINLKKCLTILFNIVRLNRFLFFCTVPIIIIAYYGVLIYCVNLWFFMFYFLFKYVIFTSFFGRFGLNLTLYRFTPTNLNPNIIQIKIFLLHYLPYANSYEFLLHIFEKKTSFKNLTTLFSYNFVFFYVFGIPRFFLTFINIIFKSFYLVTCFEYKFSNVMAKHIVDKYAELKEKIKN